MKTVIFFAILLIGSFAANSQSILPENPDNLVAMVISASSNGMQNEWSVNSDKHKFSDLFPATDNNALQVVTTSRCICNVTVTDNSNGSSFTSDVAVADCPSPSNDLPTCKVSCKYMVAQANARSGGANTSVLNSWRCQ